MPKFLIFSLLSIIVGASGTPAIADISLSLSSPTDLSKLTVGQQFTVDVNLQGLPPLDMQMGTTADFIFILDSKVLFPSAQFAPILDPDPVNNTSGLTPGSVFLTDSNGVNQRINFNAASRLTSTGAAGDFSDSFPGPSGAIGQNGTYYSFTLQAISAGSGSIYLDPSGNPYDTASYANRYAADDTPGYYYAPLTLGSPLAFTVSPAAAAVPEPTTFLLAAIGMAGLACHSLLSRRPAGR